MTPIQQCLQSLAVLAKSDDLNGISLAESKIDEFVRTAGTESAWQIVALDDLKHEITDRGWGTTCSGHMLDYIARQRAAIAAKSRTDAAVPLGGDAYVAHLDARQQTRERRSFDSRGDRARS